MESSYGIGVKNRYAIFLSDEEGDPLEIINKSDEKPSKEKKVLDKKALNDSKLANTNHQNIIKDKNQKDLPFKSKTTDGSQTIQKNKDSIAKGDPNRTNRSKPDRIQRPRDVQGGDRPNHISDRQNRPPRHFEQKDIDDAKNQRNREERFGGNDMRERRERSDSDRRGPRNPRNSGPRRGGGRFGGDDQRRGKRELDRHSGSDKAGVKAVDKRDGGGAHNWGKIDDFSNEEPFAADNHDMIDKSADETGLDVSNSNQENDTNSAEELVPAVEEPKEMTLEEYKQQIEGQRVQPKFNLRKPGEGEDNSQWKKTFILKKKVEDEEEVEYEEIEVEEDPRKGRHKQVLDIEINFRDEGRDYQRRGDGRRGGRERRISDRQTDRGDRNDKPGDRRDNRERGDRGGNRGGRGGGGGGGGGERQFGDRNRNRRPRDSQVAPKVDDWNDFPSLATA
ncbi:plasminogen activator inhibitor 1 RNA-binding protein-like [Oppia nitens]|uniref:plasminogen activator inhibitor 1 RNA-binding protein-like n=1 Tax=Oppia nitens TaxID=1686743 RepID=UPI0023DB757E|nr:plasminogen activator inhibitor 1 RNA-binding protein-like [Oppia nitens]